MEDVLEVYARPRDEKRPLVCLDEFCKQLIADTREPVAAQPGQFARTDYEYEGRGMCSAFMAYSPLEQWRGVRVSGRRTALTNLRVDPRVLACVPAAISHEDGFVGR